MKTDRMRLTALVLALALLSGCGFPAAQSSAPPAEVQESETVWGVSETSAPIASVPFSEESPAPEQGEPSAAEPIADPGSATEPEPLEPEPLAESDLSGEPGLEIYDEQVEEILSQMTPEEKAAQLFVVTPDALTGAGAVTVAGALTRDTFEQTPVGGIVYMGANLEDSEQTREMLSNMQEISMDRIGLPAFLCVDEEGGTVARISGYDSFGVPEYPDMSDVGASGDTDRAREIGEEMGDYLSDLGFNVDFAPVADVWSNAENSVVKYRAFSSDPDVVASMAAAFSEGLSSRGVLYSYKHFPGHGNTAEDSHLGFAESDADLSTLRDRELVPFRDGIENGVPMIMVGHISLPNVTGGDLPASLSREIITDLLREELGYDGIVITDALNMGAIADNYGSGEAALMALEAGADLLLMPGDFNAAYEAVTEAILDGTLSGERIDESLKRILRIKLRLME